MLVGFTRYRDTFSDGYMIEGLKTLRIRDETLPAVVNMVEPQIAADRQVHRWRESPLQEKFEITIPPAMTDAVRALVKSAYGRRKGAGEP